MSYFEWFVIYIVIWWVLFFIFLPIGSRKSNTKVLGQDSGAPEKTYLWKKFIVVSILALLLTLIIVYVINNNLISIIS